MSDTKPSGKTVAYAVDPAGNPVQVQEHQLADSLSSGYKPVTSDIARALQRAAEEKQYVDQNWGTAGKAAAGVADGLTMGLAPSIASRMGLIDQGHLEAAQESGAYTAGEVGGMIAPALLTGGESAAARVLGATPMGAVTRLGGSAERLVARMLPEAGLLGKGASATIKMAARGATEGALINSAHQASQDIIQNKPLAAQSLLAAGAQGALFGGAVGGLLGGAGAVAGAGIDMAGGAGRRVAAGVGGGAAEESAIKALRHMGMSDARIAAEQASESIVPTLKKYVDVVGGVEGVGQKTSVINAMARAEQKQMRDVVTETVSELSKNHPTMVPSFQRMDARIIQDVSAQFEGKVAQREAKGVLMEVRRDLGKMKTWEGWTGSRDTIADRLAAAPEGSARQGVYKTALNAFDSELRTAMEQASPELMATYTAAASKGRNAGELAAMTAGKGAAEQGNVLHLNGSDAAIAGFGAIGGTPLTSAGIIAGKKISAYVQEKLQPVIAEAAARSALGASAASAQVQVGRRISDGLKQFITGGARGARQAGIAAGMKPRDPKPNYSMAAAKANMALMDELTSQAHQNKVRETSQALTNMGHEELANEMAMTYGRAVAYINATKPKGRSVESAAGKLTKQPKDFGHSSDAMKFIRISAAISNPVGTLIDGLHSGNISREAVAAVKYVYPDIHQDIVLRASQEFMAMKSEGKSLPADKVALIGTLLNAPVDTTLQPEFIAEIQKAHAANKAPAPDQGKAPEQVTDVSSYQTPLQQRVG